MYQLDSLSRFGFNPSPEARRLSLLPPGERVPYFKQQLESYINHLAKDEAVSILYKYWPGAQGKIFTSPSLAENSNVFYQVDPHERNGLFYQGILSAVELAKKNKNSLVLLYSPTGKKLFADTPIEAVDSDFLQFLQKPYQDGQLYFLYFDGKKINNVAVSINSDRNPWLYELAKKLPSINEIQTEEKRMSKFLSSPELIGDIDNFFAFWEENSWKNDLLIYTNQAGKQYFLCDVIAQMKQTFAGKKPLAVEHYDKTIDALVRWQITADSVQRGYFSALQNFMSANGLSQVALGGGCGGSVVTSSEASQVLGSNSSISSQFRYLRQDRSALSVQDAKNDPNLCSCGKPATAHFHCPGKNEQCQHPIIVGEGTTRCPSCGLQATCK